MSLRSARRRNWQSSRERHMPARDRRTGFSRRRQYGAFLGYVLAVAGAVVGAVLLVISTTRPGAFAPVRMTAASVTAPVSSGLGAVARWIGSIPTAIGTYFYVHSEKRDVARGSQGDARRADAGTNDRIRQSPSAPAIGGSRPSHRHRHHRAARQFDAVERTSLRIAQCRGRCRTFIRAWRCAAPRDSSDA